MNENAENNEESGVQFYNHWGFVKLPFGIELRTGHVHRTPIDKPLVGPNGEWLAVNGSTNIETFVGKHQRPYVTYDDADHWMSDPEATEDYRRNRMPREFIEDNEGKRYRLAGWEEEAELLTQQTPSGILFGFKQGAWDHVAGKPTRVKYSWQDQLVGNSIHKKFYVLLTEEDLHPEPEKELWNLIAMAAKSGKEVEHE